MLDTKSNRKNRICGTLISLLLLAAISVGVMAFYPAAETWRAEYEGQDAYMVPEQKTDEEDMILAAAESFANAFLQFNYSLYWKLCQKNESRLLAPSEVFLPEYLLKNEESPYISNEEIREEFDSAIKDWFGSVGSEIQGEWGGIYSAALSETGIRETNTPESLEQAETKKDLLIRFSYDDNGILTIPMLEGLPDGNEKKDYIEELISKELNREIFHNELEERSQFWETYASDVKTPRDFVATYRIPYESIKSLYGYINGDYFDYSSTMRHTEAFCYSGFWIVIAGALLLVLLLAVFLPLKKSTGVGECIFSRVFLELSALGFIAGASMLFSKEVMMELAYQTASGELLGKLGQEPEPYALKAAFVYGLNFLAWLGVFALFYQFFLTVRRLFTLGFRGFIKKQTLTGRIFIWVKRRIRRFLNSLYSVDLEKGMDKTIFKIVLFNFVILAVLSCFWFFGIFLLIIYSVILFFFIKKYADEAKKKYAVLLKATNTMAEGNLNIRLEEEENLGIFEPLKNELTKVQQGFKKAVDEETKSQQMKTELITNVSHDLKTPLTAIITYVNLLKEDTVTEEERRSYIDTLDKKSQRLKTLIEDLFEVSKANSNNVTLHPVEVDLGAMIKQAALECEDRIKECGVEFRYQIPEEKITLKLDSEKTYRIFENLIINITKYALPGSRAYISLKKYEGYAVAVLKNISAQELDFDSESITERFARGDKARSTEGSGLGLAIVKSFTQLQNGSFEVVTDGDLFKAIVTLPL